MGMFTYRNYYYNLCLSPWVWVVISLLVVSGSVFGFHTLNRDLTREGCYNWGKATERPVRFEYLTSWDYACYTPGYTGKWVPTSSTNLFVPTQNFYNVNLKTK
jgi:hypothetical protein